MRTGSHPFCARTDGLFWFQPRSADIIMSIDLGLGLGLVLYNTVHGGMIDDDNSRGFYVLILGLSEEF